MARAFGYCRASTAGQHYTFDSQRKAIQSYYDHQLKEKGYEFGGWFEDRATSGAKPLAERAAGKELWDCLQPGDCIVWSKLDRAFRNVIDGANTLNALAAKGVSIHSLDIQLDTSSSLGKFVMNLLVLLGELERDWISTRTREALAIRQERGLPHGRRPPAGWKKLANGTWVPDEAERDLLQWAIEQHDRGGVSWERLAALVKKAGVRRANGDRYHQPWFHYAVKAKAAGYPGKDGWRKASQANQRALQEGAPETNTSSCT
jgi:DNA invertase Pin-like site-specific DNA recombinase